MLKQLEAKTFSSFANNPQDTYDEIKKETHDFIERIYDAECKILHNIEKDGVYIKKISELNTAELRLLEDKFQKHIKPFLTPTILDVTHPFPNIPNGILSIVYKLSQSYSIHATHMVIVITPSIDKLVKISSVPLVYVYIEDVIEYFLNELIPPHCTVEDFCFFKLIRDYNVQIEEDIKNMSLDKFSITKKRLTGRIVRVFTSDATSVRMKNFLIHTLHVREEDILKIKHHLGLESFYKIISHDRSDLSYQSLVSRYPKRIRDFGGDYFKAIAEKDIIVHHPFESFEVFIGFLHQAATDPAVVLIKQTLYRTNPDSQVVQELIRASENGKQVVVLVELRASMDEENNINLAKTLEENGIQVIYGSLNYKTHAKICLIVRKVNDEIQEFLHIGTGNYHPLNAKIYTDLSLFTTSPTLCNEANDVFNFITGSIVPLQTHKLFVSPLTIKERLLLNIKKEIQNHKDGKPSGIWLKCNAITDKDIITALCKASEAGVQCQLIIRGVCTLVPCVHGVSENITVRSIVGCYLEHSRIYCFAAGHEIPSVHNKVYISSADLMTRNLDSRIEIMVDIENETVRTQIVQEILANYMKDTKNSWLMQQDGTYVNIGHLNNHDEDVFDVHEYFITHESMSGHGLDF